MGNGHGPPRILTDSKYQAIKSGAVVTSGTYEGCILVDSTYYWVAPNDDYWDLNTGAPDETQTLITVEVWDKCKDGGTLSWNSTREYWEDRTEQYRWAGNSGQDVELDEV